MKVNTPYKSEFIIQKVPSDMGIHRNPYKGTLNAPGKILEKFESKKNILIDEIFPDEFNLEETHQRIHDNTKDLASYNKPLISIGGDHSVSFPVIKSLKQENPDMELIWLDAHLDLKEKVDGHVSHDVVVRELLSSGFSEDEITFVGITRIDEDEEKFLEAHNLTIYRSEDLSKFLQNYESNNSVYLSIDIDVLKKAEAPGTGYPDGRLSTKQVQKVIEKVSPNHADLVEVAPVLDRENKTLENAGNILGKLAENVN